MTFTISHEVAIRIFTVSCSLTYRHDTHAKYNNPLMSVWDTSLLSIHLSPSNYAHNDNE